MAENANMRRFTAVALLSCVFLARDARAQSTLDVSRATFTPVHHYVASEAIPTQLATPSNVVVPRLYQAMVDAMLRRSPTFRRQCVRLSGEGGLTVQLVIGPHTQRSDLRAMTRISRTETGQLVAVVEIPPLRDVEELIAHEFEHIIEQLDGVDLAAQAQLSQTGVTQTGRDGGIFETVRATRMGLRVASELRQ